MRAAEWREEEQGKSDRPTTMRAAEWREEEQGKSDGVRTVEKPRTIEQGA
jgi:hypothetical protein